MYAYDRGGNILNKKKYAYTTGTVGTVQQTIAYTYNSAWKDKLATYNGTALTYDAMGNLTNDGSWAYTWICGRQLRRMYDGTTDICYGYDHNGLGVSKNVNGTVTNYTTTGGRLTHVKRGSEYMHIFYDGQGRASLFNKNGAKYTYVYNLQGDVVGILDESGSLVVEYKYDAWGKLLGTTGSLASTIGKFNPLRYRGYVYDEETGLYYLRSRYYNPEWGRFINADEVMGKRGALLSHNLFAYCRNRPVKKADRGGRMEDDVAENEVIGQRVCSYINDLCQRDVATYVPGYTWSVTYSDMTPTGAEIGRHNASIDMTIDAVATVTSVSVAWGAGVMLGGENLLKKITSNTVGGMAVEFGHGLIEDKIASWFHMREGDYICTKITQTKEFKFLGIFTGRETIYYEIRDYSNEYEVWRGYEYSGLRYSFIPLEKIGEMEKVLK